MNGADGQALPRLSASDYFVQTWGVLVAAYRELNARKLFWVALVLNGLVIAAMAAYTDWKKYWRLLWLPRPRRTP